MGRWTEALGRGLVILDGPMGTAVEDAGWAIGDHPLWGSRILLEPGGADLNDRLHRRYLDAGADVLTANTHNLSLEACRSFVRQTLEGVAPLEDRARELCEALNLAALASVNRVARPATVRAACTMSPDRAYAEAPSLGPQAVAQGLGFQTRVFAEAARAGDLDLVIYEMISTEPDLEGALTAGQELPIPFAVGLTCDRTGRTRGGVPVERAAAMADRAGASAVFVQCTPVDGIEPALRRLGQAALWVGAYANDGRRWSRGWEGTRIPATSYLRHARRWVDLGARAVGGCCGTSTEHIRRLVELRSGSWSKPQREETSCTESTAAST